MSDNEIQKIILSYRSISSAQEKLDIYNVEIEYPYCYTKSGNELFDAFWWFGRSGGKQGYQNVENIKEFMKSGIETASEEQLRFFVFDFTREEKIHDGLFGGLCEDGVVGRVVDRLEQLESRGQST